MSAPTRSGSGSGAIALHHVPSYKRPSCALGVLMTGYLDKWDPNAYVKKVKRRFIVLTHESVHWFKRAAGSDLFGEERGSISLGDISTIEMAQSQEGNSFIISTTNFTKRVFVAQSKEEAARWLGAIQTAMKNRYLYRRETLTGLSFMQTMDEGLEAATRPRILLMSLLRGGGTAGDAAETVVARNVEYERGISLPALVGVDRLLVTFVNGAIAQLAGADVIAHAQGPKEERLSAAVVGGGLAGSLIFTTTLVKQGPLVEGPTSPRGAAAAVALLGHVARALLLQPEHAVPLLAAGGLLAAAVASLTDRQQQVCLSSFQQACGELRFGTMVFVAVSLLVHVLLSLLLRVKAERGEGRAQAAEQGAALAGTIYLEVEDFLVAAPQGADGAGGGAEGADVLSQIPQRYVDGCLGDMAEAARRWRLSVEWRRQYGTDAILEQAHPYFKLIKECYPHYFCGVGRDGNPVYYERSGQVDQARLRAAGCGTDELVWHYIYATEFCYNKLHPRETAKTITVFDVEGVGIRDLAGDAFEFLRKSSSLIQEHYPERSVVIMIVNAPSWFSFLWKMIKPMVNERTQKKVKIVGSGRETHSCISEFVDPANMPKRYGGQLSYGDEVDCRFQCPEEVALRAHVEAVNAKLGVESKMG